MGTFSPKPAETNVSIVDHSVTVFHEPALRVSAISDALNSSGYEIFDTIIDPASKDLASFSSKNDTGMQAAIQQWKPWSSAVDETARRRHDEHCQMCNAGLKADGLEDITASDSIDERPAYIAIISIEGMTCSSCIGTVTNAVKEIPSVVHADVSLVNHSGYIQLFAEDLDSEVKILLEAIEDVGYGAELVEVKPQITGRRPRSTGTDDLWEVAYAIEGMTCSSCVGNITNAVNQLECVQSVNVDLIQHSGTIRFRGRNNEELIRETIEDSGYDIMQTEIKSLTKQKAESSLRTASVVINGMHCPECPRRILSALKQLPLEVEKSPSLDDSIITVSYNPDAPTFTIRTVMDTIQAVDRSFEVSLHRPKSLEERSRRMLARERKALLARVILAITVAIPTLIIGVVYMNLVPHTDAGQRYLMEPLHGVSRAEWATFIMATPVYFFATDHFHRRTIKEVYALWRPRSTVPIAKRFYRFGSMNMLISLGTTIAYFSSLAELIVAASNPSRQMSKNTQQAYFDSVVFLTMFLLMGRYAEAHMKAKSGDAVAALGNLRPTEALLISSKENDVEKVSVDLIDAGDVIRVLHGSSPPCDGSLLDEAADFDESSLTGESRIIRKSRGDEIFAGTINKGSALSMRVTGPAGASMLDCIIQVVREGQAKRAPVERVADLLTSYFVPAIVLVAILTWLVWLALGFSGTLPRSYMDNHFGGWSFWSLQFAIAVFVIACPCGLGLAAPTALFVGGGMAAKRGILVKGGGEAFQEASSLDCVVFDKTGTLTEGAEPKIVEHNIFANAATLGQDAILAILKSVEENSGHPLARAAVAFADSRSQTSVQLSSVDEIAGKGMKASFKLPNLPSSTQYEALIGNESLMQDYKADIPDEAQMLLDTWKKAGYSIILLACRQALSTPGQWTVAAIFAAADPLRPEAGDVVASLQAQSVQVYMLSGDNEKTAIAIGEKVGIPPTNVIAGVLPTQKAEKVKYLQKSLLKTRGGFLSRLSHQRNRATVAMVGDGINDAPALAAADVGIAVASGSDVAVQSAAFVLVHSDLRAVLTLVTLSRAVFRRVIFNFFWAAIYNIIALPIAAGVLYPIKSGGSHVRLDPAWAALAMALSSISVVGSSLLLRTGLPGLGFRDQTLSRPRIKAKSGDFDSSKEDK
jgi:heavy metal translocating P-type ATPase